MTLSALLVCIDEAAAQVLSRVLEELSIRVEPCPDLVRAGIRLAQERFDLVIVHGKNDAEVVTLLRDTKQSRVNDKTLAVAVVQGQETIRELFALGVNFVLYKPVAYDRALSSLRAAREVMRKDKRKNARTSVHTHATIDYANISQETATLINLGQDGMQVKFGQKLPPVNKVYFQFTLPGEKGSIRLSGQVVWQEWSGRAGIQFVDVPKASRKAIADFLAAHPPDGSKPGQLPGVAVEVEEPLRLATMSTVEQTHGMGHGNAGAAVAVEAAASISDAGNRRAKARYACRLGAEVYLGGKKVPNHCCLTDLSAGGCYLEVPLTSAVGAPVEIVVRTHEIKLHVWGSVQASHAGYGMGVAFALRTKDQQASVNKLIEFVASTTKPS